LSCRALAAAQSAESAPRNLLFTRSKAQQIPRRQNGMSDTAILKRLSSQVEPFFSEAKDLGLDGRSA
jgi:hypothetical protein